MTDEVKGRRRIIYKSMFETACCEAVKRCGKMEDSRSRKIQNNETCDVLLVLDEVCASFFGTFGADGYSGFSDHRPADLEVVMTGAETAGGAALRADYVTEMEKSSIRLTGKILARRGIEY